MLIDHSGAYIFHDEKILRAIGRASAPIWFYFVGRYKPGHFHWDIIIYGIFLSAIPAVLDHSYYGDVLISIVIIRAAMWLLEKAKIDRYFMMFFAAFISLAFLPLTYPLFDYGSLGLMIAYCGYFQRMGYSKVATAIYFIITILVYILVMDNYFKFDMPGVIISSLGPVMVMACLYFYQLKTFPALPNLLAYPVKLIARYSLEFYTIQVLFFIILANLLK